MVRLCKVFVCVGLFCVGATSLQALQRSKIISIPNLNGAPATVTAVWVSDTTNFSVHPLIGYPISVTEAGTLDVNVTIKPHDGVTRSTEIFFKDAKGNIHSYAVTMTAPQMLSSDEDAQPGHGQPVYPNPANDFCTVDVDINLYPNVQVDLLTSNGARALGLVKPKGDKLVVDTRNLSDGKYNIVVSSNGVIVKNEEVVVRH